jgi:penicillin-insensitive murein endopeptidase
MKLLIFIMFLFVPGGFIPVLAASSWGNILTPLPGSPRVIGFYSGGCLVGAASLPLEGEGFQVMRPSRNRYYGHPNLIAFVKRLGQTTAARGDRLLIGDLSQPRGGPMSDGHRSHQLGLDVDIWFYQLSDGRDLSRRETEKLPMLSMVRAAEARLDPNHWLPIYQDILRSAAQDPEVERIFVNPIIKQVLCQHQRNDRSWLHKIRPWWGHDAHFHVRLRCPSDSPQCQAQKPPPPEDGCNESLEQWVKELQQAVLSPPEEKKISPPKPVALPQACQAVLTGRSAKLGVIHPDADSLE